MADQNSSNKRGMNTIADDIDYSGTLTELERIGARASRKGIQRTQLEERISSEGKALNSLLAEGQRTPMIRQGPFYDQQVSEMRGNIKGLRGQMNSLDSASRSRAESEASTYISRQFSQTSINGQVSGMQSASANQNRAFSMMGQTYDQIAGQRSDVMADIRVRERGALNEVKGMFTGRGEVNPERSAALGVMMGGAQDSFKQLAVLNAAQVLQKTQGNDPNSRLKRLSEMGQTANSILGAEDIAKEVRSGGINISSGGNMKTVANQDVNREIIQQAHVLSQALKELADGVNKTDKELAELRTTADEAAENMDKLQKAEAGGAGGGRGNLISNLNATSAGFNALGNGAQQLLVNQKMQDTANIGGFANLANQQYDMYRKARGGDIASQLALGNFGEADKFGMEIKGGQNIAQTAYGVGAAAQTAAGVVSAAEAAAQKANPLAYAAGSSTANTTALQQGIVNTVQGGVNTAVIAADMYKGTTAQAARLGAIQADMSARQAINYVGAEQAQGLRNMFTGADTVAQGFGSGASDFIKNATSSENLGKMANSRMSPEQFLSASQQGIEGMGSTFNTSSVFAARNLERNGFGSTQQNIGRMSTLASAGSNNPQAGLESVLTAAVAKGLDSSKSIDMMVNNTASMVASNSGTAVGIDTVGASAGLLASSMNPNIANKETALQQAMSAQELTRQQTTNRDVSFSGMANTAGLQKALNDKGVNIDGAQAIALQGIDAATLKSLKGDSKRAAAFFQDKGINITESNADAAITATIKEKQLQVTRAGTLSMGMNAGDILEKQQNGTLSAEERRKLNLGQTLAGRTGGAEYDREVNGLGTAVPKSSGFAGSGGDLKKQTDDLRTSGFKQLTEAAQSATAQLDKFGGALKVFTELQNKYEAGGTSNEDEFSTAGSNFAKDFKASIGKFDTATSKYETASKNMIVAAGLISKGYAVIPNLPGSDKLNQPKGSGRSKGPTE